jgi:hypothetical protein
MFSFTEKLTVNLPYISSEKLIGTSRDSNPRPPLDSRMPEPLGYRSFDNSQCLKMYGAAPKSAIDASGIFIYYKAAHALRFYCAIIASHKCIVCVHMSVPYAICAHWHINSYVASARLALCRKPRAIARGCDRSRCTDFHLNLYRVAES